MTEDEIEEKHVHVPVQRNGSNNFDMQVQLRYATACLDKSS